MRRADRLFEIIQILRRTRQPISARAIADELEVSQRTVYRDMAALMAQRVPIRGEAGIGYVLGNGFDMPALMLTRDEIDAAVLGALWVATRGEPDLARSANDLIAKIHVTVPPRLRPQVLQPATSVAPLSAPATERVDSAMLRHAIRAERKIALVYRDEGGAETRRVIWPILLGYRDVGRILAAWCELREGFRYFRTDRMVSATALAETYPEQRTRLKQRWQAAMDEARKQYASPPE